MNNFKCRRLSLQLKYVLWPDESNWLTAFSGGGVATGPNGSLDQPVMGRQFEAWPIWMGTGPGAGSMIRDLLRAISRTCDGIIGKSFAPASAPAGWRIMGAAGLRRTRHQNPESSIFIRAIKAHSAPDDGLIMVKRQTNVCDVGLSLNHNQDQSRIHVMGDWHVL